MSVAAELPLKTIAAAGGPPPGTPAHLKWLIDTDERLKTADGKIIEVWELRHGKEEEILSAWAKHFRAHYCSDASIDFLRGQLSRKKYLEDIKFPSRTSNLGPSVRAGDFAEILVADFLQWILSYSVPRVRWNSKIVRDESPKGSDVIGFYFEDVKKTSSKDALAVFESKASFSGSSTTNRMQDAINDSAKDRIRIDESLNYIKQRLFETGDKDEAQKIERFQNPVDLPYREVHGAAALYSVTELVDYIAPDGTQQLMEKLNLLQKMLKCGLSTSGEIVLYELGFSDRTLVGELSSALNLLDEPRRDVARRLTRPSEAVTAILENYPSYFSSIASHVG